MQRSESIDILLVSQNAEDIKLATLSFREFFPDCHVEAVYRIEDAPHWAQHTPWRLILIDEQLIAPHPPSILLEIKRLAPSATLILQSERGVPTAALDALHAGADFLLYKKSPTFLSELMLYAKDVFEKQDTRNALEQLHDRHSQLIESLTDVLYELDPEGRFVYLSPNVATMLGYSAEELVGTPYSSIIAPDQLDRARHRFDDRRTGTRASRNIPIELTPKSHPHQPYPVRIKAEVSAKGLYNLQRQHLGTRGLLRDLSHEHDQEETIRRLTRQLHQTDQLIAAAQHLVSLSKDLESPQTNVLAQSQRLLDAIRDIHLVERMEALAHSAEQAARLGEAMTRAAADSDIRRQTINDIVESALTSSHPAFMDQSRIERVYAENLPPFQGQRDSVMQLLRTLLLQALRYTTIAPTHHRIRISTGVVSADAQRLFPTAAPSPLTVPVEIEILIEETDEIIVEHGPLPQETGDLFKAYAQLKQLGGRLDFLVPSSGRLSIKIRIPVEPAPPGVARAETVLLPQTQTSVITKAAPVVAPIPASPLPDRRSTPRILVHCPAHITIGERTHVGTMTCFGQGGMDVLVDNMLSLIENQQAYVLLKTDDAIVELQAVAHNRSVELNRSKSEPIRSHFVLSVSSPIDSKEQQVLSLLLKKAQAGTLSMAAEVLLTSEASHTLVSDITGREIRDTDHRETVRVRVKLPVHAQVPPPDTMTQHSLGVVINLSRGGACLQLDHVPGKLGDSLTLSVSAPKPLGQLQSQKLQAHEIMLPACIIWTGKKDAAEAKLRRGLPKPSQSIGVCFTTPTPSEEQVIDRIIALHIISSMNVEHVAGHSSFVNASWECRNDRQQVIAVTDTHLRHQISSNMPIVIIVPGYGRTQADYLPLAFYLAAKRFRVLRYDHTNHVGLSDGEIVDTSLSNMQTDLQALLLLARTTWPTVDITLVAEDVAARVALKTMALSSTADRLLLVNPVLDIGTSLFSTYGQDVVADYQRGLRKGITNLWGLNVNLDHFIGDTITGQYGDWQTAAADLTALPQTPIVFTTPKQLRPANHLGLSAETFLALGTSPIVITLSGTISTESAHYDKYQAAAFQSIARQISTELEETHLLDLTHALPQRTISHRLLTEKERIRIRHHIAQANQDALTVAHLARLPHLLHLADYGTVQAELYQQLLPIDPGMTVLDVGCEHSDFAEALATNRTYAALHRDRATGHPLHYIGLSQSHEALAVAQQQLHTVVDQFSASIPTGISPAQLVKTTWLACDWGATLPFEDQSIDRVLHHLSLPFARSPLQCLREAIRVLRPNGAIAATSFRPHTDLTSIVRHHVRAMRQDEFSPPAQGVLLLLGRLHEAIRHGMIHSYEPKDFENLCIHAGGRPLRVLSIFDNQLLLAIVQKTKLSS